MTDDLPALTGYALAALAAAGLALAVGAALGAGVVRAVMGR
jgi:hypothetical protein